MHIALLAGVMEREIRLTILVVVLVAAAAGAPGPQAAAKETIPANTPKERYDVFESLARRMQTLAAGELAPGPGDQHPLSQYVTASIEGIRSPVDTLALAALAQSTVPLMWRMSPAFPDTSAQWLTDALELAKGCDRMGLVGDAVEWLRAVDDNARDAGMRCEARRLLIRHYVVTGDSVGLEWLWESWTGGLTRGAAGRNATAALMAAFFIRGDHDKVAATGRRFPRFGTQAKLFDAYRLCAEGAHERAREAVAELVWTFDRDTDGTHPPPMKLAALVLAADLDWLSGLDGYAGREYALLAGIDHRYLSAWSQFMLGSIDMHNRDYASASGRFRELCASGSVPPWQSLGCTLEKHATAMIRLMGERE